MSKTVASMNLKFYRLLETPLNVLEMLKVVYIVFTWYHNKQLFKGEVFSWGEIARFQAKIPIIQIATKFTI